MLNQYHHHHGFKSLADLHIPYKNFDTFPAENWLNFSAHFPADITDYA